MFSYYHHIGDFIKDTARLNDSQCMAYLRLLWIYYDTENPLPADHKSLAFQIGSNPDDVLQILQHYFVFIDGKWVHNRVEKELQDYRNKKEKAKGSANARWKNANAMRTHTERNANGTENDANREPRTENRESKNKNTPLTAPEGVSPSVWSDFLLHRKKIRAELTKTALEGIQREAMKAGWSLEDALRESCTRGWRSFKAEWVADQKPQQNTFAGAI